jgi:acyl-lipid omega-6 desaturase (Delta-12 desaturase)
MGDWSADDGEMSTLTESHLETSTPPSGRVADQRGTPAHTDEARLAAYRTILARYRSPVLFRSVWQLVFSIVPFVLLWGTMWFSLRYSYWLTLLLALPTAGFLVRLFILQHDCGHGSFFKSKLANDTIGCALSLLTLVPYHRWRKIHALHHATSGDLDRRGHGDVHMLTVQEYRKLSPLGRLIYRIHRHPAILFGIGPFLYFVVLQRFAFYEPRTWKQERASVHWTNVALLAGVALISWIVGFKQFLLIHVPVVAIGSSAGVWLFYVQHQFETGYWRKHERWNYFDAGFAGSSYYQLPALLQWFTANIGLHHIHHLDSKIPNYNLQECFDENPALQHVARLTLWESLSCASLKLWDEEKSEMVRLSEIE